MEHCARAFPKNNLQWSIARVNFRKTMRNGAKQICNGALRVCFVEKLRAMNHCRLFFRKADEKRCISRDLSEKTAGNIEIALASGGNRWKRRMYHRFLGKLIRLPASSPVKAGLRAVNLRFSPSNANARFFCGLFPRICVVPSAPIDQALSID